MRFVNTLKPKRNSDRVSLKTLSTLERITLLRLEQIKAESDINISDIDGFNAEMALAYYKAIKSDKRNDVLGLLK